MEAPLNILSSGWVLVFLVTSALATFLLMYPFKKYFFSGEENEFRKGAFYLFSFLVTLFVLFALNIVNSDYYKYLLQVANHLNPFLMLIISPSLSFVFSVNPNKSETDKSETNNGLTIPISIPTSIGIFADFIVSFVSLLISVLVLFGQLVIYILLFVVLSSAPILSLSLAIAYLATLLAVANFSGEINVKKQ